ncbi:MAG TPA: hypothetical protein VMP68_28765 [Candidatus Eisenbacteria bacterium]|nr:hypothetical protein [Candidatus Eisenbacteria bacterium]
MTTTLVTKCTSPMPTIPHTMQDIPLIRIQESKTNPRREFDEAKLAELADFVPRNKIGLMWRNPLCGVRA